MGVPTIPAVTEPGLLFGSCISRRPPHAVCLHRIGYKGSSRFRKILLSKLEKEDFVESSAAPQFGGGSIALGARKLRYAPVAVRWHRRR